MDPHGSTWYPGSHHVPELHVHHVAYPHQFPTTTFETKLKPGERPAS